MHPYCGMSQGEIPRSARNSQQGNLPLLDCSQEKSHGRGGVVLNMKFSHDELNVFAPKRD